MKRIAGSDLVQAAQRYGDRTALIEGQRHVSFTELDDQSNALADWLHQHGCEASDKVAVWLFNGVAVAECFLALDKGAYIRASIDAAENADFAHRIMESVKPKALIADSGLLRTLNPAWWPRITISVGDALPSTVSFEEIVSTGAVGSVEIEVDDDSLYEIYVRMVAGGQALAVEHTRRNWRHEVSRNQLLYLGGWYGPRLQDNEVFLNVQQLMHGTAIMGFYPLHCLGYPIVMLPAFEPQGSLQAIQDYRITTSFMVPGMVERMQQIASKGRYDTSSLRRVLYGGAPISRESLTKCIDTFGDVLIQLYGRADGAWPVTILDPADHKAMREGRDELWGSCGKIAPFLEVRVADAELNPVVLGTPGEIVIRGDGVTPAAGAADGWCHTTDLAVEGPASYLRIVGRTDEMINTGSYHVYPREIEEVLLQHPDVAAACVMGTRDVKWGEAVTAYIVPKTEPTQPDLTEELTSYCRDRLSRYKVPKAFHFIPAAEAASHGGLSRSWLKETMAEVES